MSWQALVDQYIKERRTLEGVIYNCVQSAAIVSKLNGVVWANTPDFSLSRYSVKVPDDYGRARIIEVDERLGLLHAADNEGLSCTEAGLWFNGEKYYLAHSDERSLYLRKFEGGACISWTRTLILFGSWSERQLTSGKTSKPQTPALCIEQIESLCGILFQSNY